MELIREYLVVSFLFRQKREKREMVDESIRLYGAYVKKPFREYSPEMVRKEVYKMFGKG